MDENYDGDTRRFPLSKQDGQEIVWTDISGSFKGRLVWLDLSSAKGRAMLTQVSGPIGFAVEREVLPRVLSQLRSVRYPYGLQIRCSTVTDAGPGHLEVLENLTSLDFCRESRITDVGLRHINGLVNLTRLNLSGTRITDAGLEHLKELTKLTTLDLSHTYHVTGAGLEHLNGLANLTTLSLVDTQITDAGLEHLKGLVNLMLLDSVLRFV